MPRIVFTPRLSWLAMFIQRLRDVPKPPILEGVAVAIKSRRLACDLLYCISFPECFQLPESLIGVARWRCSW